MSTAERIRNARETAGMTQKALGLALGFSGDYARVSVARWEAGTRPLPIEYVKPIARQLGLDPLDLLPD